MNRDPYTILGVKKSDTLEDIKRAFHKLAHKHHPDKGGDAEKFKEISEAYAWMNQNHKPQAANIGASIVDHNREFEEAIRRHKEREKEMWTHNTYQQTDGGIWRFKSNGNGL